MATILVTGKSGSGKSTISRKLAERLGYRYIDVDTISHSIYNDKTILARTIDMFGDDFVVDGKVDRKILGKIVFNHEDESLVQAFNDMAWEYIERVLDGYIGRDIVIDWILSPITKYWNMADFRILVQCERDEDRFSRIMVRDSIDIDYVKSRDKASVDFSKYTFDYIFDNSDISTLDDTIDDVIDILSKK